MIFWSEEIILGSGVRSFGFSIHLGTFATLVGFVSYLLQSIYYTRANAMKISRYVSFNKVLVIRAKLFNLKEILR